MVRLYFENPSEAFNYDGAYGEKKYDDELKKSYVEVIDDREVIDEIKSMYELSVYKNGVEIASSRKISGDDDKNEKSGCLGLLNNIFSLPNLMNWFGIIIGIVAVFVGIDHGNKGNYFSNEFNWEAAWIPWLIAILGSYFMFALAEIIKILEKIHDACSRK